MAVVTDGLKYYWNYQSKCSASGWENIAPSGAVLTGVMNNITFTNSVPTFNGTSSSIDFTGFTLGSPTSAFTLDCVIQRTGGLPDQLTHITKWYGTTERVTMSTTGAFQAGRESVGMYYERGGGGTLNSPETTLGTNILHVVFTFTSSVKKMYLNGQLVATQNANTLPFTRNYNLYLGCNYYNAKNTFFNGKIYACRGYTKALSDAEVLQNYNNGIDIGMGSSAPIATVVSSTRTKISRVTGAEKTLVTFKFDKDVQAYKVMVGGSDYATGLLADSGGAKTANTNIVAEIDHTELGTEGLHRVTIYGQGTDGTWSTKD
ncbi:concanavalin A-like lectin/glucanase superfamily protein [Bacillus phage Izhevsk]|uniref:Concanavalin A-like lectin/glucanase superfamily protein n=1 Tax=Bacillus phage Izhevsk TaxID=2724322 RepID=A0A6H0X6C6_9CAUD|nr:concanavalin A-like lectin/glucanase superfamily protein [Bacillus phage Izhevsk]QIW89871.1 concanavalin A-like lectin/glucanase superfamily protein [Bacillus phage Izhevsk]